MTDDFKHSYCGVLFSEDLKKSFIFESVAFKYKLSESSVLKLGVDFSKNAVKSEAKLIKRVQNGMRKRFDEYTNGDVFVEDTKLLCNAVKSFVLSYGKKSKEVAGDVEDDGDDVEDEAACN